MSTYEAFRAGRVFTDTAGRRIVAPFGPRGDAIVVDTDADADRIARGMHRSRILSIVGIAASLIGAAWSPFALLGMAGWALLVFGLFLVGSALYSIRSMKHDA